MKAEIITTEVQTWLDASTLVSNQKSHQLKAIENVTVTDRHIPIEEHHSTMIIASRIFSISHPCVVEWTANCKLMGHFQSSEGIF
jgi:hypothetical protein